MKIGKENLISPDQDVKLSSIYIGYLILNKFKKIDKIFILDLFDELRIKTNNFNYSSTLYALSFLYISGIIDFSEPYIYKLKK